jgi:hypothetical protein
MPDLRQQLTRSLTGRVCLFGVGHVEQGDDAFGVRLAESLVENENLPSTRAQVVIAGRAPERWLGRLGEGAFDHVVLLDAVECGAAPRGGGLSRERSDGHSFSASLDPPTLARPVGQTH